MRVLDDLCSIFVASFWVGNKLNSRERELEGMLNKKIGLLGVVASSKSLDDLIFANRGGFSRSFISLRFHCRR